MGAIVKTSIKLCGFALILCVPALAWTAAGCASGNTRGYDRDADTDGYQVWWDAATDGTAIDGRIVDADGLQDGGPQPDAESCAGGCTNPPTDCYESPGSCVQGQCIYDFKNAGAQCDDSDNCTTGDQCDGSGHCDGQQIDCTRPHASGGTCVNGSCTGWNCDSGWDNCDGDWSDGCEQSLNDVNHCGSCSYSCPSRAHANLTGCTNGNCQYSCQSPWEDCDNDMSNGCEIPTGIPNQCDALGLNSTNGCWTAHCGSSSHPDARNFVTWYCFECSTCHVPAAGQCQWCNHATGVWYDPQACVCGAFEDLVCAP
jgi:hypothetical protein